MMLKIIECKTATEIALTYSVMYQLRPHITETADYVQRVEAMFADGYRSIGCFNAKRCVGVMGIRIETRLFCGRMIYVDDLVTDENARSQGVGKALLDWLKTEAKRLDIEHIMLDSGTHRHSAHKFYLREGFHIAAFNFRIKLN